MDAGLAAIIGAVVGAFASLGAAALGAIPGFSAEDRNARIASKAKRDALVLEVGELFLSAALPGSSETPVHKSVPLQRRLALIRSELATVLPKKDRPLLEFFDEMRDAVTESSQSASIEGAAAWSVIAPDWIRGIRDPARIESAIRKVMSAR